MLSDHEQQVWDDVRRFWAVEAAEPPAGAADTGAPEERRAARWSWLLAEPSAWGVLGALVTVVLVLVGGPVAGFVGVGAAVLVCLVRAGRRSRVPPGR